MEHPANCLSQRRVMFKNCLHSWIRVKEFPSLAYRQHAFTCSFFLNRSRRAVEHAEAHRLADILERNRVAPRQIGDGARDLENAIVGAG